MQKKLVIAALVASVFASVASAEEAASPISYNVGVTSDYLFRGVSQTHGKPALSAGVDYAHSSGLYVGAWASTITWVKDNWGSGSTEIDLYGGYKGAITGDLGYDVGFIAYNYPGHGNSFPFYANPNTQEVYAGLSYKWLSAKYSYATSSHFIGWGVGAAGDQKSRGSDYLELNANYDMGDGWTLIGHVGHQKVKGFVAVPGVLESANYTDWKIGVSKDVGFGVVTAAYSDTNAKGTCPSSTVLGTSAYCWGNSGAVSGTNSATSGYKDVARGTVVLSFTKSF